MSFHTLVEGLRARYRLRTTVAELSRLSDAQLDDIGVTRWDIEKYARRSALSLPRAVPRALIRTGGVRYSGA